MKWIPAFAVKNPVLIHMGTLLLLAAGAVAFVSLPREEFQNVSVDEVEITTVYPGAAAEEIEKLITIPLEDEIADVDQIKEIASTSAEGVSRIWVEFEVGVEDMYRRAQEIQTEVDKVIDLPAEAETPEVKELEVPFPLVTVSLGGGASELELKYAAEELEQAISDIPGVEDLQIAGVRDRELWVEVDPERMEALGLTLAEVGHAIRAKNKNVPGGRLTVGERDFIVRTMGEAEAARDLERVVVRATPDGGQILLGDVATVTDTFEDAVTLGRVNGHRAVTLTVNKSPDGDTIEIVRQVRKVVARLAPGFPAGIDVDFHSDHSVFVERRFEAMGNNALVGFVLVFSVLYLFIGFRAAVLTALGIPIAFMGAIFLMDMFGLSFNLLCIFALVMVLGMIVDDAIIVCENVYRHIEDGETPARAAVHGTQEVMGPVTASVLTTIAAFLPLLLFSGTMGKFFSVIPKVVIFALSASLVECFFALPSHLADFAKPRAGRRSRRDATWYRAMLRAYTALLRLVTQFRYATLLLFLVGAAGLMGLAFKTNALRFQLFPAEDIDFFTIRLDMPVGTPLSETERTIAEAERMVEAGTTEGELEVHYATVGFARNETGHGGTAGTHLASLNVDLTDTELHRRQRSGDEILSDLRDEFRALVGPEAIAFFREYHGPPVGKPVQVRVRGKDFAMLQEIADEVQAYLHTLDGVVDIKDDYTPGKEEIRVHVDEDRAAVYGIDVAAVADVVRTAVDGTLASTWFDHGEEIDVVVKYRDAYRRTLEDIEALRIPNRTGALVPFKNVATIERVRGVSHVTRYDRERVIHVLADLVKGRKDVTSKSVNEQIAAHFADYATRWPGYTLDFGGEFEETDDSLADLQRQFLLALLLIYVILGSTFRSFIQPITIMVTVPFAFIGVVYGLILSDEPLGMMSFIGVIALAGIVVNDSIVLLSYVNRSRERGMDRMSAVIEGGQTRLRPILLTSITTIFGLLPMAAQWFGREPLMTSMAVAIVWGLTFSTVLTLVVIPAVYLVVDDLASLLRVNRFRHVRHPVDLFAGVPVATDESGTFRAVRVDAAEAAATPEPLARE